MFTPTPLKEVCLSLLKIMEDLETNAMMINNAISSISGQEGCDVPVYNQAQQDLLELLMKITGITAAREAIRKRLQEHGATPATLAYFDADGFEGGFKDGMDPVSMVEDVISGGLEDQGIEAVVDYLLSIGVTEPAPITPEIVAKLNTQSQYYCVNCGQFHVPENPGNV